MKKIILVLVFLSIVVTGTFGQSNKVIQEVSDKIDEGDYYVTQFRRFSGIRVSQTTRNEPTAFTGTGSNRSRSSENKYRPFNTSIPSSIREHLKSALNIPEEEIEKIVISPSEQDIDRAIASYEEALKLLPSGTWRPNRSTTLPPEGGIQARLENARQIKQQWLAEKQQKEEQLAKLLSTNISIREFNAGITREDANFIYSTVNGQNYAVDKATRSNYQVYADSAWHPANVGTAVERQAAAPNSTPNSPDDFNIEQNAEGGITIRGYTGTRLHVVIPETISGIRVTAIYSFYGESLRSVVIPNTVTYIAPGAFERNPELSSVVLPNAITVIQPSAFKGCKALQTITIPNSVTTIFKEAFMNCGLTSITLSNRLESIGEDAFRNNKITSIQLPASLKMIGRSAFCNNQITNLVIPGSVISLGVHSFGKNPLSSLVIPASLAKYDENATQLGAGVTYTSGARRGFWGAFTDDDSLSSRNQTLTSVTLPANVDDLNMGGSDPYSNRYYNFENSLINFYKSQNKRAGTYVKEGRIWTVR